MNSFEQAIALIAMNPLHLEVCEVLVAKARGFELAVDVSAPMDNPPFSNAAVDGFAVRVQELALKKPLALAHTLRAAEQKPWRLPKKTCAAIMTGAPLPYDADAVIMKEDATLFEGLVSFAKVPALHENIRFAGEDIKKGMKIASKGQILQPQHLGLLLALGIDRIKVFKKPRVAIIATGDELVMAPKPLRFGEVYFFVGPMLQAQCEARGIEEVTLMRVPDEAKAIERAINTALDAELVLISGGMSKGDRDLVVPALKNCGVEQVFYQGLWRPGKPLFFGTKGRARIFGLPGNPVASFVCFRIFVEALLARSPNSSSLATRQAILTEDVEKKTEFTFFARAFVNDRFELRLLEAQGSHQMGGLCQANALCHLEAGRAIVKAQEAVKYYAL